MQASFVMFQVQMQIYLVHEPGKPGKNNWKLNQRIVHMAVLIVRSGKLSNR